VICDLNHVENINQRLLLKRIEMKKNLFAAILLSTVTVSVIAQSKFEGPYAQVGIGYESVSPSLTYGNYNISQSGNPIIISVPTGSNVSNSNSFAGNLTAGYNFLVTKDFLLGIGVDYSPISGSKSNFSTSDTITGTANGQWNKEYSYNIFLSPAISVSSDGLLYGKVGYTSGSFKSQYSGESSVTKDLTGYTIGIGYKQFLTEGLYGFGEVNYAGYNKLNFDNALTSGAFRVTQTTTISANTINVLVGLGYRFY
jgi:outer membrane immunogenic protein